MRSGDIIAIIVIMGTVPTILVLSFGIAYVLNKKRSQAFQRFSESYRLDYTVKRFLGLDQNPKLKGAYQTHPVEVGTYKRGVGKNKTVYTYVSITVNEEAGFQFSLGRENWISKVGKSLGMTEQYTGDQKFDEFFLLKTNNLDRFRQITPEHIKENLYSLFELTRNRGSLACKNNRLVFATVGGLNHKSVYHFIEGCLLFGVEWADEML